MEGGPGGGGGGVQVIPRMCLGVYRKAMEELAAYICALQLTCSASDTPRKRKLTSTSQNSNPEKIPRVANPSSSAAIVVTV